MAQTPNVHGYKSILTLVMFLLTNLMVVFPFHVSVRIPGFIVYRLRRFLKSAKVLVPFNFITMPPIVVLLLLGIGTIGRKELHDGIIGAGGYARRVCNIASTNRSLVCRIKPIDIMALFLSLAYISLSLDASGLLRFLAFWVLKKGGSQGRRLYFLLYTFFFVSGLLIGNDPVILSGTAFLAYMTRVAGIIPPTAWIYAQFAVANISSAVLVSSNPTNLVLAGAFNISFIIYAVNVIIPVLFTAAILFPFLLYFTFASSTLIPRSINIGSRGHDSDGNDQADLRSALIDKRGAIFGCILLVITLAILLVTSATGLHVGVYAITVPAATIMLVRDTIHDYTLHLERRDSSDEGIKAQGTPDDAATALAMTSTDPRSQYEDRHSNQDVVRMIDPCHDIHSLSPAPLLSYPPTIGLATKPLAVSGDLSSFIQHWLRALSDTFPTVSSVMVHIPFALLLFAFSMFVLVQGLSSQGWVEILAQWWSAWVHKTGSIGAVAGMASFPSVCATLVSLFDLKLHASTLTFTWGA
ncbi:hypothetical protein BS47DRAFT_259850 [Hydnum rufescens UP504]|uniref:Citrate transporter-like domain-containing protein n=1 Tax=Hydnum rufescens UP504 TaxID=1448309 RepID=A0A9P6B7R2_9AGAM|nr:hypothetical protein BS47DRAFT_259850 [Hydnum rufescens UP504]